MVKVSENRKKFLLKTRQKGKVGLALTRLGRKFKIRKRE